MISTAKGKVIEIISRSDDLTEIIVESNNKNEKAINYNKLTGDVNIGDKVLLNTTAVSLGLGTGGYHYVIVNYNGEEKKASNLGHIMKLRYTPLQLKTLSVEEEESPHREKIKNFKSLNNLPVVIGSLHSQLPAVLAGILSVKKLKPVYIMTDGAALPIAFSKTVKLLKEKDLLKGTITAGHAFGGDLEAVNVYTALIASKEVLNAEIVICLMGPGIVGTGTEYGFTGVEQGEIINTVSLLGGKPIAIPRISFADKRERHIGVSHHSATSLGKVALKKAIVPIPVLPKEKMEKIYSDFTNSGILEKHSIVERKAENAIILAKDLKLPLSTMGRNYEKDPEFFLTAAAAGIVAAELTNNEG